MSNDRLTLSLQDAQTAAPQLAQAWAWIKAMLMGGHKLTLTVRRQTRSLAQNARLWAMLTEVSRQVIWHGKKLSPEAWKHVFSASLKKQDVVPGLHGEFVVIGQSTSQMSVRELGDLMELIAAFGAERGVVFAQEEFA